MEPRRNMNTDSVSSLTHTTELRTTRVPATLLVLTTWPTWVTTNTRNSSVTSQISDKPRSTPHTLSTRLILPHHPSTGDQLVLLPQLRTKDHAVHAGPSPPLVLLKELTLLPLDHWSHSQSNNSLIAQRRTEISVVMVVLWTTLSPILKRTRLNSNQPTHTRALVAPASTKKLMVNSTSSPSPMLLLTTSTNSSPLLPNSQFQLPLKPTKLLSNSTPVESSTQRNAEPTSTTVSSSSDTALKVQPLTGSSRTLGAQPGENPDT